MTTEKNLSPALGLVLIAIGIFIAVSLLSYHPGDAGNAGRTGMILNYSGRVGAELALYLFLVVGASALAIPLLITAEGINRLVPHPSPPRPVWLRGFYELLIVASLAPLLSLQTTFAPRLLGPQLEKMTLGGWWGGVVSSGLLEYLGDFGTRLILMTVLLVSIALLTEMKPLIFLFISVRRFFSVLMIRRPRSKKEPVGAEPFLSPRSREGKESPVSDRSRKRQWELEKAALLKKRDQGLRQAEKENEKEKEKRRREKELERMEKDARRRREKIERQEEAEVRRRTEKALKEKKLHPLSVPSDAIPRPASHPAVAGLPSAPYQLPPADLLDVPPPLAQREIKNKTFDESEVLESTLLDFGIESRVVGLERGPAITRYELQIAPGVKVGRVKALDNDIALTMKAKSVRILAPIPGKAAIGIEVPNTSTTLVYMREMIESAEFKKRRFILPISIGKDISGHPIITDLTLMPHLLIAGATGSGKTVCINSIIISLLYSRTPDELKLILVDPKKVEMAPFHHLPHLLCPVITDAAKVSMALAWVIKEMEDRYEFCARAGVRNIQGYNARRRPSAGSESKAGDDLPETMPYIILLIDELADLMLVASKEIESSIARLAHLSRAVGIHLILATQRPSVDVITGIIKANLPSRISFKVAAKVDSRTVLDAGGADKLLGNGDLLFLPPATDQLIRAQGTICHEHEINNVVAFVNRQREPIFEKDMFQKKSGPGEAIESGGGEDIFLESAIEVIRQTDQASVSMLQRKLKIGYSRAARIMDELEDRGIVGPYRGTKAREILIDTYAGDGTVEKEEEEVS